MTEIINANDVETGHNTNSSPLVRFSDGKYGVMFDLNRERKVREAEEAKRLAEVHADPNISIITTTEAGAVVPETPLTKKVTEEKKPGSPTKKKAVKKSPQKAKSPKGKTEKSPKKKRDEAVAPKTPQPIVQLYGAIVRDLLKAPGYRKEDGEEEEEVSIIKNDEENIEKNESGEPQEPTEQPKEEEEDPEKQLEASNKLFNLGWIYYHGFAGVPVSYDRSYAYFYKAASLFGNPMAHYYMGLQQLEGKGTEQSDLVALENFRAAEKCGRERGGEEFAAVGLALYQIAKLHENGQIVVLEEMTEEEIQQKEKQDSVSPQRGRSESPSAKTPPKSTATSPSKSESKSKSLQKAPSVAPPKDEIVVEGKKFKLVKQPKNIDDAISFYIASADAGNKDGNRRAKLLK
eukprot:Tbor_TRINITY_DN4303_c0_g2::TRINITY_DN4303_c0_g2_i1::g.7707::m.7707